MSTPMDCNGAEQALAERLSQPVGPGPAGPGLTQHLADCAACRRHEAETRVLMETLRDQTVPDPGPSYWRHFSQRVRRAIESPGRTRRRRRALMWPAWATLAAAALLAIFFVRPLGTTPGTHESGPAGVDRHDGMAEPSASRYPGRAGEAPGRPPLSPIDTADVDSSWNVNGADPFADLASSLAAMGPNEAALDSVLDGLLGEPGLFELLPTMNDLSPEQQRELLDTLHAALDEPA